MRTYRSVLSQSVNSDCTYIQVSIEPVCTVKEDVPDRVVNVVLDSSYVCQYCAARCDTYLQLKGHMVCHKDEQVSKFNQIKICVYLQNMLEFNLVISCQS